MERNSFFKRCVSLLLALIIFSSVIAPSILTNNQAYAHEAAVIIPMIDASVGRYSSSVDYEDSGFFKGGHKQDDDFLISAKIIIAQNLTVENFGENDPDKSYTKAQYDGAASSKNDFMTLGWPGKDKDAKQADFKRATDVATTLTESINTLVGYAVNNSLTSKTPDGKVSSEADVISNMIGVSNALDPAFGTPDAPITSQKIEGLSVDMSKYSGDHGDAYGGRHIVLGNRHFLFFGGGSGETATITDADITVTAKDPQGNLYAYMWEEYTDSENHVHKPETKDDVSSVIWAMPKGYSASYLFLNAEPRENEYVTCFMISAYANALAIKEGEYITASGSLMDNEPNFLLKLLYNLFDALLAGLRALLGLYDMEALIFNVGSRGGSLYEYGLMHRTWWATVLKYFTVVQLISWMAIAVAIAKMLIETNFGLIKANSGKRVELMDAITKLMAVGMLLTLCIPIIRLMCMINNSIVDIFAATYSGDMSKMPQSSNIFVGLVMMVFWFGMQFYVNFIYIMRAITLAVLVAMAPFFIVTIAFSKKMGLFEQWLKEVAANIFLQAFHAFAFSFLFEVIVSGGRTIERIAVVFSVFPLTDFFRTMVFGQAGSFAVDTGKKLGDMAKNTTKAVAGAAAGKIAGGVAGKIGIKNGFSRSTLEEAGIGGNGGGGSGGGSGGSGGSGGGKKGGGGGGAASLSALGRAMQERGNLIENAAPEAREAAQKMQKTGRIMSAVGGIASTVGGAVGGLDKMMSGMTMGDAHAMREGAQQFGGTVGGAVGGAVGEHMMRTAERDSARSSPNGDMPSARADAAQQINMGIEQGRDVVSTNRRTKEQRRYHVGVDDRGKTTLQVSSSASGKSSTFTTQAASDIAANERMQKINSRVRRTGDKKDLNI